MDTATVIDNQMYGEHINFIADFALDASYMQISEWAQRKAEGYEFQSIDVEDMPRKPRQLKNPHCTACGIAIENIKKTFIRRR